MGGLLTPNRCISRSNIARPSALFWVSFCLRTRRVLYCGAWDSRETPTGATTSRARLRRFGGDDLHRFAVLELVVERYHAAVDLFAPRVR